MKLILKNPYFIKYNYYDNYQKIKFRKGDIFTIIGKNKLDNPNEVWYQLKHENSGVIVDIRENFILHSVFNDLFGKSGPCIIGKDFEYK